MARVLVINSGSSSLKLQIVDTDGTTFAAALAERIGDGIGIVTVTSGDGVNKRIFEGPIEDHTEALEIVLGLAAEMGITPENVGVSIIGHRVVHGGKQHTQPTLIDAEVRSEIERLGELAPLHNPANLRGIDVAREMFPGLPHVAVFDTGFFATLPPESFTYAVPRDWDIRRYGFHGTSHAYVSDKAARTLGRPYAELNQIVLHLGNGASASAIRTGVAIDTSMGMTPLEGLVMGTRGGDVDPGALVHLMQERGMSPAELAEGLNRRSGLKGMSGVSDFRELLARTGSDDAEEREHAELAYAVTVHRLVKYIGAYWAELGRLDVLTFTGGVGENAARLRADVIARFAAWGLSLDDDANTNGTGTRRIGASDSAAEVLVVHTNEEVAIARMARDLCREN